MSDSRFVVAYHALGSDEGLIQKQVDAENELEAGKKFLREIADSAGYLDDKHRAWIDDFESVGEMEFSCIDCDQNISVMRVS